MRFKSAYLARVSVLFMMLAFVDLEAQNVSDTVRIGDPRFAFSHITDSSFFYSYQDYDGDGSVDMIFMIDVQAHTYDNGLLRTIQFAMEYPKMMLYGIALGMTYDYSQELPWDYAHDTVWLKVRRGAQERYIEMGEAVDSVRISLWSEKKTLLLEGYRTGIDENGRRIIFFDSVIQSTAPLYCGYFERPISIEDTSFFISLELVAHSETVGSLYPGIIVACSRIEPEVLKYEYVYGVNSQGWRPWVHDPYWPAILPIVAPQGTPGPGWEPPEPTEGIDNADNSELKVYPNPVRKQFSVQCGVPVLRVEMYDVMGRKVRVWEGAKENYDIGGVGKGFYTVKVVTVAGTMTKSLAVED